MLKLEDLKKQNDLIYKIDWEMTPEEAVRQYLEWGNNNNTEGKYVIRSKNDVSYYFVVNTWKKTPKIYLVKRNSENAEEIAEFEMPDKIKKNFYAHVGSLKGVYPVEGQVKSWLKNELEYN